MKWELFKKDKAAEAFETTLAGIFSINQVQNIIRKLTGKINKERKVWIDWSNIRI